MKRALILLSLVALLGSCTNMNNGELVGVLGRKAYIEPDPYGMLFIPAGSFTMGPSDQDIAWTQNAMSKTVSIDAFWMDETEITNNEYRQFVFWVRDSIIRKEFAISGPQEFQLIGPDPQGSGTDITLQDKSQENRINWEPSLMLSDYKNERANLQGLIDGLGVYYQGAAMLSSRGKEQDVTKFIYNYYWIDLAQAAKAKNRVKVDPVSKTATYSGGVVTNALGVKDSISGRESFLMEENILVYPDTLVWISDFTYSYNEPMTTMYFWHPSYDNYPVVGVTWKQANAFCNWRTNFLNDALASSGQPLAQDYRLPIEAEWEFAARGNLDNSMYPWGGVYLRNKLGCFVANFKPLRGNYIDDGALTTERVATFSSNEYGLYDMAGNVAEWTINAYDPSAYVFSATLNPNYKYNALPGDPPVMKRKVIRGGSWKDVARYLQVSMRDYEYQDTAKSYVGFRCVRSYLGT
jgi:formylglycine-generating enzyme